MSIVFGKILLCIIEYWYSFNSDQGKRPYFVIYRNCFLSVWEVREENNKIKTWEIFWYDDWNIWKSEIPMRYWMSLGYTVTEPADIVLDRNP